MTTTLSRAEEQALEQGTAGPDAQRHLLTALRKSGAARSVLPQLPPSDPGAVAAAVVRLQMLESIAQLEQRRLIVRLIADGVTQVEVARLFGVSQPTMNGRLQTARQVAPVREGFSGASPGELCQRYAAGLMSRAQLVDELSRWDYPAVLKGDPWDDLVIRPEGSFNEVGRAFRRGLIDAELYDEILDAVAQD